MYLVTVFTINASSAWGWMNGTHKMFKKGEKYAFVGDREKEVKILGRYSLSKFAVPISREGDILRIVPLNTWKKISQGEYDNIVAFCSTTNITPEPLKSPQIPAPTPIVPASPLLELEKPLGIEEELKQITLEVVVEAEEVTPEKIEEPRLEKSVEALVPDPLYKKEEVVEEKVEEKIEEKEEVVEEKKEKTSTKLDALEGFLKKGNKKSGKKGKK